MVSDNLDARKTALEDSIDSLSSWMIGFTCPVAIGLVMEFYAIFNPAWTREWNVMIDRIGLLLVTAGVFGELAVEHKTHGAERSLREVNTLIERKAGIALKAADERIAELNLETERLRHSVAMRKLTREQIVSIQNALLPFRYAECEVSVTSGTTDFEAMRFAGYIDHALRNADLNPKSLGYRKPQILLAMQGFYIIATPEDETQALGAAIWNALKAVDVAGHWYPTSEYDFLRLRPFWPAELLAEKRRVLIVVCEQPKLDVS
jgi:hypothetical protein